jgi:hypothetical protein
MSKHQVKDPSKPYEMLLTITRTQLPKGGKNIESHLDVNGTKIEDVIESICVGAAAGLASTMYPGESGKTFLTKNGKPLTQEELSWSRDRFEGLLAEAIAWAYTTLHHTNICDCLKAREAKDAETFEDVRGTLFAADLAEMAHSAQGVAAIMETIGPGVASLGGQIVRGTQKMPNGGSETVN